MSQTSEIFRANLSHLRRTEPELADRIDRTPAAELEWADSKSGPPTASVRREGRRLALASRYDPLSEARTLIEKVDFGKHAGIVALGFGLGYHVAEIAARMDEAALLIVYEPDRAMLRAALERLDHTSWLGRPNVLLADGDVDRAALVSRIDRYVGPLTLGTLLLTHPPSRQLHGSRLAEFGQMVTDVVGYCRTNVATHLVNASRTFHNLCHNLPYYAAGATTDDLFEAARGCAAVCVGAGPSLARNVDLLADPDLRRRVVVISAQTTLKPLLDRGIRPDYVTALDYSVISSRFYEGLPPLDDVTLVAEPLAHPSILDAFPGPVRVTPSHLLDKILGELARPSIAVQQGATVAHLSFYVAQHLGCDPIIMIGQDLAFSDGMYYCPGTAIDDVWLPELGAFNTVEMMQWQRIVRHRGQLEKGRDIRDEPVYLDEQMATYLKQFERDFARAPQLILDATEGGVPKAHTQRTTLRAALEEHVTREPPEIVRPPIGLDEPRLVRTIDLLSRRLREVADLRGQSARALELLRQIREHQDDTARTAKLFDRLTPIRRRVDAMQQVFEIVAELNTVGTFNRVRADRAIAHAGADAIEEQRLRLLRDIDNVDWIIQACEEATGILGSARRAARARLKAARARSSAA
ncbi:MAG: hypothetical protein CMJ18_01570 [Phycisphaeraceae bacterium]|nr:hypothetical protein [Phycisphaeraceae bacterium]